MEQDLSNQKQSSECRGMVIPAICFEEIFENSRSEIIRRKLCWKKFHSLNSRGESFDKRSEDVYQKGKKERINLPSELRKFIKTNRPELKYKNTFGRHLFYRSLSPEIIFGIAFETIHHMGLGKAFTVCFIIEHIDGPFSGHIWIDNLFRLYGEPSNWPPCWTYSTKSDLGNVFKSVDALWNEIVPIFESNTCAYFTKLPEDLPDNIKFRGPITARQGLPEAQELALLWDPDAKLNSLSSGCLLSVRDELGPAITPSGQLNPHGYWTYSFFTTMKKFKTIFVRVLYAGKSFYIEHSHENAFENQIQYRFKHLDDSWLDSNEALSFAENYGGRVAREEAKQNFDINAKLEIPFSNHTSTHRWHINYLIINNICNRKDLNLSMNPNTGSNIKVEPF